LTARSYSIYAVLCCADLLSSINYSA